MFRKILLLVSILFFANTTIAAPYVVDPVTGPINNPDVAGSDSISINHSTALLEDIDNEGAAFINFDGYSKDVSITSAQNIANADGGIVSFTNVGSNTTNQTISIEKNAGNFSSTGDNLHTIEISGQANLGFDVDISNIYGNISANGEGSAAIKITNLDNQATSSSINITNLFGNITSTSTSSDNIIIEGGVSTITHFSGTISAANNNNAIYFKKDGTVNASYLNRSATLNFAANSATIVGKIKADGENNFLNLIGPNLTTTHFNNVKNQLVGNWSINIKGTANGQNQNSSFNIAEGEEFDDAFTISGGAILNNAGSLDTIETGGATINNSGSIDEINSVGSSNISNSGTIGTVNATSNAGVTSNSGTIGTINNTATNGEVSNLANGQITNLNSSGNSAEINNSGQVDNASLSGSGSTFNNLAGGEVADQFSVAGSGHIINNNSDINLLDVSGTNQTLNMLAGSSAAAIFVTGPNVGENENLTINTSGVSFGDITGNNNAMVIIDTGQVNLDYTGVIAGETTVIKAGQSRLTLGGTSTHTGNTIVFEGELKVNGSIAQSAVDVQDGATISGTGTVGALNISSGATLAAGNSIGNINAANLNLNAGSNTEIEFNNLSMDKTTTTGNIQVAGAANFKLYNYGGDNNFVVSQNILESTGGNRTGQFDRTSIDDDRFIVSTSYTNNAVRATISKKLNSSTLDAPMTLQNSIGRIISQTISSELQSYLADKNDQLKTWASATGFDYERDALSSGSSKFSSSGYVAAAGLVKGYEGLQIIGGIFNSKSSINRQAYFGKDDVDTNGITASVGKKQGNFYNFAQLTAAFYNSDNKRNVTVNGIAETSNSSSRGSSYQVNIGSSYAINLKDEASLKLFTIAGLQSFNSNGFRESGLSYGNFSLNQYSAKMLNIEGGFAYKNGFFSLLKLPEKSSFEIGLSGYQSTIFAAKDGTVLQGNASYVLDAKYNQGVVLAINAGIDVPFSETTAFHATLSKRQNSYLSDIVGSIGLKYEF